MLNDAYIVSSVRTAVGKAKRGSLKNVRPENLGAVAVNGALNKVGALKPEQVDDVLIGCAMTEGEHGMNMGRVIAQVAGLPDSVPAATINRFCSSGLQTIAMAAQSIMVGQTEVVVAGGAESMSIVPMGGYYYMPNPDLVKKDPDFYLGMGLTAENLAERHNISREDQDVFSLRSHQRATEAIQQGKFVEEIVPVFIQENVYKNGTIQNVEKEFKMDDGPRTDTNLESLAKLKPVFKVNGTVTAGSSSQMSDGAAATVVMSGRIVENLDLKPIARLVSFAVAGVAPEIMGIGPVEAVPKALKQAGLKIDDIEIIELNEAFAAQALAVISTLDLNEEIVNVNGGAIALEHPLGCTGAKLTATLLHEMKRRGVRYGMVTMCIGGGMGAAGIFENLMR